MKIFISWSGERSKHIAVALRAWIPLVLHYTQPWMSHQDIAAGDRWAVEIAGQLEGTHFGIVVLASDNLSSPWILYECGALSKSVVASAVCPYLLDVDYSELVGPLAQFQAKRSDKQSTLELIESINRHAASGVHSDVLRQLFEALWPKLEHQLQHMPPSMAQRPRRPTDQVLEDLYTSIRGIELRMHQVELNSPDVRREKERDDLTKRMEDSLLNSRTADNLTLYLKDGRVIQGALIYNPFKRTGRIINIDQEISIDFTLDDIRDIKP